MTVVAVRNAGFAVRPAMALAISVYGVFAVKRNPTTPASPVASNSVVAPIMVVEIVPGIFWNTRMPLFVIFFCVQEVFLPIAAAENEIFFFESITADL